MLRTLVRGSLFALLLAASLAAALHALGQGRVVGSVVDGAGAPLAGVKVLVTSPEIGSYRQEKTTDAKGQFNMIILDAARAYTIHLEKEGYVTLEQPLKPKIEETSRETYTLLKPTQTAQPSPAAPAPDPAAVAALKGKNEAIAAFNEGVAALHAKDHVTAIAKFEQAATLDPKLAPAQAALSGLYLDQKRYPDALAAADRSLALEPGKESAMVARYEALKGMGGRARAAEALEALAKQHPGRDVAVRLFNEGAEATREKKGDDAVAYLKRALEIDRTLTPAYQALSNIYLGRQAHADALAIADRWIEVEPQNIEALQARYRVLTQMKDARAKQAKAALDNAKVDTTKDPFSQGVSLYNLNRIPEATKFFEEVVAAKPDHPKAHYMLGLCYANAGDLAKAKEQLETFLKLAPNDPDAASAQQMIKDLG
ncbi:MAG TPA: tetratricopeptide repeat protein [Thermoanaerobaculia bacterium]|nr:tetratricopeptide repeat protein [Thermoanaerobaculia bacterium]